MFVMEDIIDVQAFVTNDLDSRDISCRSLQRDVFFSRHDQRIADLEVFQYLKDLTGFETADLKPFQKDEFSLFALQAQR